MSDGHSGARTVRRLDIGSLVGLSLAVGVVLAGHLVEGGSVRSLWQPAAALVVLGGTFSAVLISYPLATVRQTLHAIWHVCTHDSANADGLVGTIIEYAHRARRKGAPALEPELDHVRDPFLLGALTLAVDGTRPDAARQVLNIYRVAQHKGLELAAEVLETAAGYTPTLGILGAVMGLIHVMESLNEPARLGAGIAVAFVATIYGVAAANLVLLPLATKLRGFVRNEDLRHEIVIEGVVAILEGQNPRLIEQKLEGYLTPDPGAPSDRRVA
ncbi:MAG TPA: flagellar motor protein [Vicinamibacterales bacterium]|nr:flagellar motor protein [Vicinamibacterales bacterium]